jgi:hypothetical protein
MLPVRRPDQDALRNRDALQNQDVRRDHPGRQGRRDAHPDHQG